MASSKCCDESNVYFVGSCTCCMGRKGLPNHARCRYPSVRLSHCSTNGHSYQFHPSFTSHLASLLRLLSPAIEIGENVCISSRQSPPTMTDSINLRSNTRSEPEAAAVHCAHLTNLHQLRPSQNFMICDAGGGTVVSFHEYWDLQSAILSKIRHLDLCRTWPFTRSSAPSRILRLLKFARDQARIVVPCSSICDSENSCVILNTPA